jgi:uncharacterized repeat protein (TIGR03803 family)
MKIGHGRRNLYLARVFVLAAGALIAATLAPRSGSAAFNEQTLYNFCSQGGCADGSKPRAGLLMDGAGNLYGTTSDRGGALDGVVFQLTPNGTASTETVLYDFCSQPLCADGSGPVAGLIMDAAGNLYGTTRSGGIDRPNAGNGVVFKLTPNGTGWTETVLYSFCPQTPSCADGAQPNAGLLMDAAGNLYGTTFRGGTPPGNDGGVVFKLTPDETGTVWTETVLYRFCSQTSCADGSGPVADLIMDEAGNLYGTTFFGANGSGGTVSGNGVVFKLTPDQTGTVWTETVLYRFCSQTNCADGSQPAAGLIMDVAGKLYGTTTGTPAATAWSSS